MKKAIIILIICVLVVGGGIWWWNSSNKSRNNQQSNANTPNYQVEKSSTNQNINVTKEIGKNNTNSIAQNTNTKNGNVTGEITVPKKETQIASFSTKIYSKDEERQHNIGITCQTLTTKEVQPGETFSFCDTVGKATSAKGYQKADIYVDGKKKQGLGGGNCQVSTTLYNAVLQVPELEVVERHQHSGHVPYIQDGKDAAVAYGSYDFKFKNNTSNVIKIMMENTPDNITAKLIKIG